MASNGNFQQKIELQRSISQSISVVAASVKFETCCLQCFADLRALSLAFEATVFHLGPKDLSILGLNLNLEETERRARRFPWLWSSPELAAGASARIESSEERVLPRAARFLAAPRCTERRLARTGSRWIGPRRPPPVEVSPTLSFKRKKSGSGRRKMWTVGRKANRRSVHLNVTEFCKCVTECRVVKFDVQNLFDPPPFTPNFRRHVHVLTLRQF